MEYSAIFHDMDKRFCYAIEKDLFVIRVQVKKDDMKEIILHYEDKYIPMEREDTRKTIVMKKVATSQFNDYYEAQVRMHLICLRYFFEFTDMQGEKVYYGNYEFDKELSLIHISEPTRLGMISYAVFCLKKKKKKKPQQNMV